MNLSISNIVFAFLLTLFAGVSTGLGGIAVLKAKITNMKFLAASLGFSAGVMIYVSFVEIFDEGSKHLISTMGDKKGQIISVLSFFAGVGIIGIIDKLIPQESNPHEMVNITELETACRIDQNSEECIALTKMFKEKEDAALKRTGIFSALAIAIHNFPEGMATFISTLSSSPEVTRLFCRVP